MAAAPSTEDLRSVRLVFEPKDNAAFEPLNNLELFVPDTFGRKSIRKTISQLSKDGPVDLLDFAVEGILLRTTLGKFCEKYGKSREAVLEILCFQRESAPTEVSSNSQSHWLSCLYCFHLSESTKVVAGAAEGFLHGWSWSHSQFSAEWEMPAFKDAKQSTVIGVDWLPAKQKLVSCLQSGFLVLSSLEGNENISLSLNQPGSTKKNSIESVLFYGNTGDKYDSIFLGAFDGSILRVQKHDIELYSDLISPDKDLYCLKTEETLPGHSQRVSSVISLDMNFLLSSSWDGTVKIWDLDRCCLTSSTNVGRPINSSTKSLNQDYLVAGNMDGSFTLLDCRQEKPALRKKFAHSLATTAVTSSPLKNHFFCTAGRDNKIKVWDSRALSTPFYESGRKGKQGNTYFTCLFWDSEKNLLLAGKSDGELSCLLFEDGKMKLS
ncbi:uncharacterized protein Gasu_54470 [Galdieria sulphuraria]|uniref:Uncharacterized protein n=1 Tax=Galdieria sulphuraria TaxID=130081 RepID=M2VUW5_GALSU|nr:uncharacterized protein Gasu_54470 [Galdieria sulphuraria]EME26996.1 hypothetical protein Gasu_54470 [Galdieria sulphuraria]|eukprot:XP_005703516.1 hypothetical protein Gasu_54470 [Galdieria sulphuraria]